MLSTRIPIRKRVRITIEIYQSPVLGETDYIVISQDLAKPFDPETIFSADGRAADQLYPRIQELTNSALTLSLNHLRKVTDETV